MKTVCMQQIDVVDAWLDNVAFSHSNSLRTAQDYRRELAVFCTFIGKSAKDILTEYEEAEDDKGFRRKYARLVRGFIGELTRKGLTVGSVRNYVNVVKSFCKYNDLPLGYVPTAKYRIVYHNRDITRDEIVDILRISRPRDRAFFCMMAQSGLRPDTLSKLRLKHLEPDFSRNVVPCRILVPEELAKGKYHAYFSFIGEESIQHLKAYLNKRGPLRPGQYLFASHGSEKRLNTKSVSGIFLRAIDLLKAQGLISFESKRKGKPRTLRLYNLRKFFRKYAAQAGDYAKFWMGHTLGVDDHYFSHDVEVHRKEYIEKAMPHLRIEKPTPTQQEQLMQKQQTEIEGLKQRLASLEPQDETERKRMIEKQKFMDVLFEYLGKHPEKLDKFYKLLEEL